MKNLDDQFDRIPSLLDRLVDDGAPEPCAALESTYRDVRDLNDSLLIDVEKLLNTRTRCAASPEHLQELGVSLIDYGLRDFSSRDLASDVDRVRLIEEIRSVVTRYEPRLCDVDVELLPREEEFEQAVRFRITASVRRGAELVVWEADYAPSQGTFAVREEIP